MSPRNPFEYQKPTDAHVAAIQKVRDGCLLLSQLINREVPQSAERTLALRKLEECSMWANKAIVFDGERYL